jgi:multidrug transporter EmrE-like cation transporter
MKIPVWGGWICAVIGFVFFGFLSVPMKATKSDAMLIQFFMMFPIMISSLIPFVFNRFHFSWYGIWSSALWAPMSCLSIFAVRLLGIGISQGVWSGITVVVSFSSGYFLFHEHLKNVWVCLVGICCLIIGIFIISISDLDFTRNKSEKGKEDYEEDDISPLSDADEMKCQGYVEPYGDSENFVINVPATTLIPSESDKLLSKDPKELVQPKTNICNSWVFEKMFQLIGLVFAVLVGILNGTSMIPAKYESGNTMYILSFGIGQLFIGSFLILMYLIVKTLVVGSFLNKDEVKGAAIYGTICGIIWSIGYWVQVLIVFSPLGLTVGMPIIQSCLGLSGVNGMIFFKELKGLRKKLQFFIGIGVLIPSFFLLGFYGAK